MIRWIAAVCVLGLFVSVGADCSAQRLPEAVQQVVDAELAFAKMSVERSTKEAFVENLSKDAIVFTNGEPVNGLELWKKRAATNGMLYWWPV